MNAAPSEIVDIESPADAPFEVVWRGYDRDQVDRHVQDLARRLEAERQRAELTEKDLRRAQTELVNLRRAPGADESHSFGHRVEKILRMADLEAGEIRRKAGDEASDLMEKARVEAEAYRHDAERQLIVRASHLDQEAARRNAAIQEREAEVAAELAAAKQRSDELRSDAEREAAQVRKHAETQAGQLRAQAEKAAQEQRDLATREVNHLVKVQDEARSGIRRLHEMLAAELSFSATLSGAESGADDSATDSAAGSATATDSAERTAGGDSEESAG